MLESAVGAAICVELATLENFTYPGDLFPSSRFYTRDLADPPLEFSSGNVFRPFEDALPAPEPGLLEKQTLRHRSVVPPKPVYLDATTPTLRYTLRGSAARLLSLALHYALVDLRSSKHLLAFDPFHGPVSLIDASRTQHDRGDAAI